MNLREMVEGSISLAAVMKKSDLVIGGLGILSLGGSYCLEYEGV